MLRNIYFDFFKGLRNGTLGRFKFIFYSGIVFVLQSYLVKFFNQFNGFVGFTNTALIIILCLLFSVSTLLCIYISLLLFIKRIRDLRMRFPISIGIVIYFFNILFFAILNPRIRINGVTSYSELVIIIISSLLLIFNVYIIFGKKKKSPPL